jgi:hypothetical protein
MYLHIKLIYFYTVLRGCFCAVKKIRYSIQPVRLTDIFLLFLAFFWVFYTTKATYLQMIHCSQYSTVH